VFSSRGFNAFPGCVAFRIGHALHLLEAGDGIAHMSGIMNRFFAFLRESKIFIRDVIAASFVDFGHAYALASLSPQ